MMMRAAMEKNKKKSCMVLDRLSKYGLSLADFSLRSLWLKLFRFKNPVLDLHKRGQ